MQSNYRSIGDYIELIDRRNTGLKVQQLLGLSISKQFIRSVANIIGTDMENYKIIRKNQFACSTMQVRRDGKMPVALLQDVEEAIISPAYPVFRVKDENQLLPEYLMMWFTRAEFDREACFYAIGGVRGSLEWEDFCDMRLPVPGVDKQREIIEEYHTITNRIVLNKRLIKKLEETAQAIYKQWFVDFEFPDENGQPYKSNGGEMINSELGEIPKDWDYWSIQNLIDEKIIYKNQDGNHGEIHPKSADYVPNGIPFVMAKDIIDGTVNLDSCNFLSHKQAKSLRIGFAKTNDVIITHKATMGRVAIVPQVEDCIVLTPQVTYYRVRDISRMNKEYLYCLFSSERFQKILNEESDQSTRKFLSILNQRLIKIILPSQETILQFEKAVKPVLKTKLILSTETVKLINIQNLLLSKLATIEEPIHG